MLDKFVYMTRFKKNPKGMFTCGECGKSAKHDRQYITVAAIWMEKNLIHTPWKKSVGNPADSS